MELADGVIEATQGRRARSPRAHRSLTTPSARETGHFEYLEGDEGLRLGGRWLRRERSHRSSSSPVSCSAITPWGRAGRPTRRHRQARRPLARDCRLRPARRIQATRRRRACATARTTRGLRSAGPRAALTAAGTGCACQLAHGARRQGRAGGGQHCLEAAGCGTAARKMRSILGQLLGRMWAMDGTKTAKSRATTG